MNSFMKRALSAVLAALMISSLAACAAEDAGSSGDTGAGSSAETTAAPVTETTAPTRENTPDSLPEDLTFNGETIRTTYRGTWQTDVEGADDGDIVSSTVYNANLAVADRLDIDYQFIKGQDDANKYMTEFKNTVLADSNEYEIAAVVQYIAAQQVTQYVFANLADTKYLNLEEPWWNREYMDKTGIGDDYIFFLAGDIAPTMLKWTSCTYFNKTLYEDNFGDSQQMYAMVENNEWTYDKLREMSGQVFVDVDNDGQTGAEDVLGFATFPITPADHFTLTSGVRYSERNEDGLYEIVLNSEHTVNFVEKFYQLLYETTGAYCYDYHTSTITATSKFVEDEALFLFAFFGDAFSSSLREMESDYGIIPFPKLDSTQESYLSSVHDNIPLYSVPVNLSFEKLDTVSAVLEAQAAENYRHVFPAMYDSALKVKYNRDSTDGDTASRMIDLIHDNATTDFVYVYNYNLAKLGIIMRTLMQAKSMDFASTYKQLEPQVTTSLDKLVALYEEISFD